MPTRRNVLVGGAAFVVLAAGGAIELHDAAYWRGVAPAQLRTIDAAFTTS